MPSARSETAECRRGEGHAGARYDSAYHAAAARSIDSRRAAYLPVDIGSLGAVDEDHAARGDGVPTVSVLAIWKIQTALASPCASRVRSDPVIRKAPEADL